MPFYIRKSVSVGPFRFNLSKSGLGVSAGVKGFRIGTGPRGNYIHMGRGGLYYRASLPSSGRPHPPDSTQRIPITNHPPDPMSPVETGEVVDMTDSNAQHVLEQINSKLRTRRIWPFVLIAGLICSVALPLLIIVTALATLLAAHFDKTRRKLVLMYDLDQLSLETFERFAHSFDLLAQASRIWTIQTSGHQSDWKRHAGAGTSVVRLAAKVGYQEPNVIATNIAVPSIIGGRQSLYFFPDVLLVVEGRKAGVVNYNHLTITPKLSRFIESEQVPSDTQVVTHTWQYLNKNGGPDRRFANNRQLPVVSYQEIEFSSPTGLRKVIQVSRAEDRRALIEATAALAQLPDTLIASAGGQTNRNQSIPAPAVGLPSVSNPQQILKPAADPKRKWRIGLSLGAAIVAALIYPYVFISSAPKGVSHKVSSSATSHSLQLSEPAKRVLEKKLLDQVRSIPSSRYEANLKIYRELAELRPENEFYKRKVERYQSLLHAAREDTQSEVR